VGENNIKERVSIMIAKYLLVFVLLSVLKGQGGYKDLRWGDSIESVKNHLPNFEIGGVVDCGDVLNIPLFFELNQKSYLVPDPLEYVVGDLVCGNEKWADRSFLFLDSVLVAVKLNFYNKEAGGIIRKLTRKYGDGRFSLFRGNTANIGYQLWDNSPDRIITAFFYAELNGGGYVIIHYIDESFADPLVAKALAVERSKKSRLYDMID